MYRIANGVACARVCLVVVRRGDWSRGRACCVLVGAGCRLLRPVSLSVSGVSRVVDPWPEGVGLKVLGLKVLLLGCDPESIPEVG